MLIRHFINKKNTADKKRKLTNSELLEILENDNSDDEFLPDPDDGGSSSSSDEFEDRNTILPVPRNTNPNVLTSTNQKPSSDNQKWSDTGMLKQILFQKTLELLVPIPGDGTPMDFFK